MTSNTSLAKGSACIDPTIGSIDADSPALSASSLRISMNSGIRSTAVTRAFIKGAGTVVWNGPLGVFEYPAFAEGTRLLAQAVADSPAYSICGGGETLAAIAKFGIADRVSYISTGGGAFLEVLEGKTLPAVAVLEQRAANT